METKSYPRVRMNEYELPILGAQYVEYERAWLVQIANNLFDDAPPYRIKDPREIRVFLQRRCAQDIEIDVRFMDTRESDITFNLNDDSMWITLKLTRD